MMQCSKPTAYTLLIALVGTLGLPLVGHAQEATSSYDFPYGYPFPDYPVAGAAHPGQSSDYVAEEPDPTGELKRIGRYALRLIQTDRAEEAIDYADRYMKNHPDWMDAEMFFMRSMAQAQLGRTDAAARRRSDCRLPPDGLKSARR